MNIHNPCLQLDNHRVDCYSALILRQGHSPNGYYGNSLR